MCLYLFAVAALTFNGEEIELDEDSFLSEEVDLDDELQSVLDFEELEREVAVFLGDEAELADLEQ